jgi:hypothetical protein
MRVDDATAGGVGQQAVEDPIRRGWPERPAACTRCQAWTEPGRAHRENELAGLKGAVERRGALAFGRVACVAVA